MLMLRLILILMQRGASTERMLRESLTKMLRIRVGGSRNCDVLTPLLAKKVTPQNVSQE